MNEPGQAKLQGMLFSISTAICKNVDTEFPVSELDPNKTLFTLKVHPEDQGRMVGKKGAVIWAIQTMLWYGGIAQMRHPYYIKLLEPEAPSKPLQRPFRLNKNWDRKKVENLCYILLQTVLPLHSSYSITEVDDTSAEIKLKIEKYLEMPITDPPLVEAFSTILHAAGMSQGAKIQTEAIFK